MVSRSFPLFCVQQACPNAGYGFEDKPFSGKESRENETGKKQGETAEPASQTPGLQGVQQGDKRAVPQSPGGLQDRRFPAQGEKGGLTGAGKCRKEDETQPPGGRGHRTPLPGGMACLPPSGNRRQRRGGHHGHIPFSDGP